MANLKIYNNGENKILMSAGDRIIRQPYEFGKGFTNGAGLNNYIEVPDINLPSDWGAVILAGMSGTKAYEGYLQAVSTTLNRSDSFIGRSIGSGRFLFNIDDDSGYNGYHNSSGIPFRYIFSEHDKYTFNVNGGTQSLSEVASIRNEYLRDTLRIGASNTFSSNTGAIAYYLSDIESINRIVILDDKLSLGEIRYWVNNGLYSYPQNTLAFRHLYDLQEAEIVTISGVDYVGIKDQIGGKHGMIMNLPAGTLQEQLDWANTNLFVPFIS